jgi:hypothetical protein
MTLKGIELNMATRPQSTGSKDLDVMRPVQAGMTGDPDIRGMVREHAGDEELVVDSSQPGALVELRQHRTRDAVFAVYLGFVGGRHHYYASTGRWIMSLRFGSLFTVSNFASMEELAPVIAELPKCSSPTEYDSARSNDLGPRRATASHLIDKMNDFIARADTVYLSNTQKLDAARVVLADKQRVKYLSLFEMANLLFPTSLREDERYPPYALYAVHTALYRDEIVFRPVSPISDCHRRDHIYEIFPTSFTSAIDRVAVTVRNFIMASHHEASAEKAMNGTPFGVFVQKVRQAVLENRKVRQWTTFGISAPSESQATLQRVAWSKVDKDLLNFLQWWAMYELFEPASRFAAYGATILRALDLYEDVVLDESVAWTLMQELGIVHPWEMPSRYKVRFPGTVIVEAGGLARATVPKIEESRRQDVAEGHRVDMTSSTVFCIDGPGTAMIDDGVSLERTPNKDEFWVHVHVADPASVIMPKSALSDYMELIPENIYLPGHFQAMLSPQSGGGPGGEIQDLVDEFSLRNGSPALTFSTKVNRAGDILEYTVKPAQIGKVVYLDPADVSSFCGEVKSQPQTPLELSVGTPPPPKSNKPARDMSTADALEQAQKDDILILHQLGVARKSQRLAKGAWPLFFPRPSVQVQFHDVPEDAPAATDTAVLPPDPYITVNNKPQSEASLVSNAMVLAGEIAARWLADRGIPAPFRQDSKSQENYETAYNFATEHVYPDLLKGIEATKAQTNELAVLTGGYQLETRPGPYFIMGLDMYVKVTSPLRRFGDLLAHWQIHAALAHERETGKPLDASSAEDIIPFKGKELEGTLHLLQMREKMARRVSSSERTWILIALVRAWQFENTAPATFRFTVESSWMPGVTGHLDWFGVGAMMERTHLGEHALLEDVEIGDQFDVELVHVNVHSGVVEVRAVKSHKQRSAVELPVLSEESQTSALVS